MKLLIGVKGTGKTKALIDLANSALESSKGSVICIEKGDKLRFDIKYQVRLIDSDEYHVKNSDSLFGFVAGILASNHDVTDLFIDSALKICNNDLEAFDSFLDDVEFLSKKIGVNIVLTSSIPVDEASETVKKYL